MNKFKRSLARMLALVVGTVTVATPLVACQKTNGGNSKKLSNKTSPLVLATDVLDGVFNPFFYTSGSDGEIVGQTQIGMLSSDDKGALIADWNEPCVAHEFSVVTTGTRADINASAVGDAQYANFYTDYYFALKDDIKFSDGVLLTKDDVLFNIYMYLDPAYNGSNTMYSVNIKGLSAYRAQTFDAQEAANTNAYYATKTEERVNYIYDWIDDDRAGWEDLQDFEPYDDDEVILSDIEEIQKMFKEEINDDWNSAAAIEDVAKDYDRYKDRNGNPLITENWQAFLVSYGIIQPTLTYTSDNKQYYYLINSYCGLDQNNQTEHRYCNGKHDGDTLKEYVYNSYFGDFKNEGLVKEYKNKLSDVITYYATANTFREYVRSDVIEREVKKLGGLKVKTISGIEIQEKKASIPDGKGGIITLKDKAGNPKSYDVLHITINGLDPKAIQNFGFTVAPGHYYSPTWDKVKTGYGNLENENPYFGVEFSNSTFMNKIRQNHLPLGAGPYKAAASNGKDAKTKTDFFESNTVVYFERNDNFLLGAPKIQKLRYQVVNGNMLYSSIKNGQVYYGSPSMDVKVLGQLSGADSNVLSYASADNLGYGYIGVSARFVPNLWVRRAIMATLDPDYCVDYYGGNENASIIRRPMSKTLKDYYDETAFSDYSDYHYYPYGGAVEGTDNRTAAEKRAAAKAIAQSYVLDKDKGNCTLDRNNKLYDNTYGQSLRYTFTIAGNTDDHPAYNMMLNSVEILNEIGFEITLKQDSRALSLLAAGELTVWAAAWSSSSDPDMYQVYHKDSKATSINAWGYSFLKSNKSTDYEKNILNKLAETIEEAREYNTVPERKELYIEAQNLLMQLAVEFPTYQRKVYYVWRKGVFDESTMFTGSKVGTYQSPLSRIWEVSFNEK